MSAPTWFMVSSGPRRQPTGHRLHPDEARAALDAIDALYTPDEREAGR